MIRKLFLMCLLLLIPAGAFPQGSRYDSNAQRTIQNFLAPIPGAQIVVCSAAGTGTPCTPTAPIYTDVALTQLITGSTITADGNGNFGFYAPPGTYKYSITSPGVIGQLFTIVLPMNAASNNTLTGSNTFSQQIISTVTVGTAPFSIASPTLVPNLNVQFLGGNVAPNSAIVGVSDTQALLNKNLAGATNGNTVTLLCSAGPAGAITGNSGVQNIFSCTINANVVANLKGLRVTAVWSHSTGTAAITYGMTLNGVACWPSNNSAATVGALGQTANFIETGSTTGNVNTVQGFFSFTATSLTGLAWTSAQTLTVTFNVANTDQVTPLFFLVELIQ